MSGWMIYGANGYTGRLLAEAAVERGERPVLAGRREEAIRPLARELGLEARVIDLADEEGLRAGLKDMDLVVHCAGPFSATSRPMIDACLATRTHYLDITGEIAVFEAAFRRDAEAKQAGVVLLPGVGFDVVPTDCLAAMLASYLPDALDLELAFAGLGSVSAGTASSAIEGLGRGGWARVDGTLKQVPTGWRERDIPFPHRTRTCVTIPWGDVSTAFHSTAIPNIRVYTAVPRKARKLMPLTDRFAPLLRQKPVQEALKWVVRRTVKGPDEKLRSEGFSDVWGEVRNADGVTLSGALTTPEGYRFTAISALAAVERMRSAAPEAGTHTPSSAFGARFVLELEDVRLHPFLRNGEPISTEALASERQIRVQ